MSGLYVYALTDSAVAPFPDQGSDLESIDLDGFYAIAVPMAERPSVSEDVLRRQHDVVVGIAARADAVLPARFASLVDRAELRRLADLRRDLIRGALDLVRRREQMTVRIMSVPHSPVRAAVPALHSTGTAYLKERQAASSGRNLPGVKVIERAVRGLVAAERVEPGPAFTTVYHLIEAGESEGYRGRIGEAASTMAPLVVRVSGPWPPFAFVPELIA